MQQAIDHANRIDRRHERARKFAYGIIGLMRDFLPGDRECMRRIEDILYKLAYEQNLEIIQVPPEMDELSKLQIEQAMLKNAIKVVCPDGEII